MRDCLYFHYLEHRLEAGRFDEAEFFGEPKQKVSRRKPQQLFSYYAQRWLDLPTHDWSINTRKKYKDILSNHWMPYLHDRVAVNIDEDMLLDALTLSGIGKKSASYYNDCLTVIRGVFKLVHKSADKSPARLLENKKRVKDEPDPFTIDESNEIIAAVYKEYGLQSGCWFQLGFYSGMRSPGEMLGLQVGDIDLRTGKIKIRRIRLTNGQIQHCTKTRETRIHNLNSLSKAAIETLLSLSEVKNGHLFCHEDGEPVYPVKPSVSS